MPAWIVELISFITDLFSLVSQFKEIGLIKFQVPMQGNIITIILEY